MIHSLPVVDVVQPRGSFCLGDRLLTIRVCHPPPPPELRARWKRPALTHFPRPFNIDSFTRYKLWERLGDHFTAGLLLVSVFQHDGCDICLAAKASAESSRFRKAEADFVICPLSRRAACFACPQGCFACRTQTQWGRCCGNNQQAGTEQKREEEFQHDISLQRVYCLAQGSPMQGRRKCIIAQAKTAPCKCFSNKRMWFALLFLCMYNLF